MDKRSVVVMVTRVHSGWGEQIEKLMVMPGADPLPEHDRMRVGRPERLPHRKKWRETETTTV
jgi:hypothetical protein